MVKINGNVPTLRVLAAALSFSTILGVAPPGHGTPFDREYFDPPLANELILAGNFAEMRSNHFHAGLDLKTQGREGLPVLAAAEGWISRIKVSPYGYGSALYVQHPNGFTTVYGHLQRFGEPVAGYVAALQYKRQRYDLDVYPREGEFKVGRGQEIARSGNTGGSFAPHLHFEIRETLSQTPVNPLLFDFDVADSLPPRIYRIKLYPDGDDSYVRLGGKGLDAEVATSQSPAVVSVVKAEGLSDYRLADGTDLVAHGRLAFGIETNDYHDGSSNRLGAYRVQLEVNGSAVFVSKMERVKFDQTRYINAHVDYGEHRKNRRWIQRSHRLPGNRLPLYEMVEGGVVTLSPDSTYDIRYTVEDAAGNTSVLSFMVRGEKQSWSNKEPALEPDTVIPRTEAFTFARNQIRVQFDPNTFYDDQVFDYELMPQVEGALSPVHRLHEDTAPLHRSMTVAIRASDLPEWLREKALLGTLTDDGDVVSAGGSYKSGFVVGRPRSFGTYFIVADTLAPDVRLVGVSAAGGLDADGLLRFKVKDDLSGVGEYNAYIDGEWILLEFDPKKDEMIHRIRATPGAAVASHKLSIVVDDNKGNRSEASYAVTY